MLLPALKKGNNGKMAYQSNKLSQATFKLTTIEYKLIGSLIFLIDKNDEDFKDYEIKVLDFAELMGLSSKNAYAQVDRALKGLTRKGLTIISDEGNPEYLTWFSYATYLRGKGVVRMRFDKALKPHLIDFVDNFTEFSQETFVALPTFQSMKFYILIAQYANFFGNELTISLSEVKRVLGIDEKAYPQFKVFKRDILRKIEQEINAKNEKGKFISETRFSYSVIKEGRKVSGLKIKIIKDRKRTIDMEKKEVNVKNKTSFELLVAYGIDEKKSIEISNNHSEEEIKRCIFIFEKKRKAGEVKNNGVGLLIHLIESGAGKETQKEIEEKEKVKESINFEKTQELSIKFRDEKTANFIDGLGEKEIKEYTSKVLDYYKKDVFKSQFIKDVGLNCQFSKLALEKIIPNYEKEKEAYIKSKL